MGQLPHLVLGFFEISLLEGIGQVFGGSLIEVLQVRERFFHLLGITERLLFLRHFLLDLVQVGDRFVGSEIRLVLKFFELLFDPFVFVNRFEISFVLGFLQLLLNRLEDRFGCVFDVGGLFGRGIGQDLDCTRLGIGNPEQGDAGCKRQENPSPLSCRTNWKMIAQVDAVYLLLRVLNQRLAGR